MRVFISSTFQDLEQYREAAFKAVQRLAGQADDMVFWSADEREPAEVSVTRVKQSDVLLLILAHRYGYIPPGADRSITELEYSAAREAGIPVLAFMVDERAPWPPAHIEWERRQELERFRSRVQREVTRQTFASPEELHALVTQGLALFAERRRAALTTAESLRARALAVNPAASLERLPDMVLHVGAAEDGLPLLMRVRRSRDIAPHLQALADELGEDEAPLALLDQFRQALEQHATERWTRRGIRDTRLRDGRTARMYVSRTNLGGLTSSLLSRVLAESTKTVEEATAAPAVGTLIVSARRESQRLESVGGVNRFLGISLADGSAYSVGRRADEWVEWRPYIFESIRGAFPDARYGIGFSAAPVTHTDAAGYEGELRDWAIRQLPRSEHLRLGVWLVLQRQAAGQAILRVAQSLAAMHGGGRVHGDLKPGNVLLTADGPALIDAFDLAVGERSPGWTPEWSAPEQVMGGPVSTATDVYPLGMMLCRLLAALPVGEIRKFRIPPMPDGRTEYDLLYNPVPSIAATGAITSGDAGKWINFAGSCLRFASEQRPPAADAFAEQLAAMLDANPLNGTIKIRLALGRFTPATLLDGTDCIARLLDDEAAEPAAEATAPAREEWVDTDADWEPKTVEL